MKATITRDHLLIGNPEDATAEELSRLSDTIGAPDDLDSPALTLYILDAAVWDGLVDGCHYLGAWSPLTDVVDATRELHDCTYAPGGVSYANHYVYEAGVPQSFEGSDLQCARAYDIEVGVGVPLDEHDQCSTRSELQGQLDDAEVCPYTQWGNGDNTCSAPVQLPGTQWDGQPPHTSELGQADREFLFPQGRAFNHDTQFGEARALGDDGRQIRALCPQVVPDHAVYLCVAQVNHLGVWRPLVGAWTLTDLQRDSIVSQTRQDGIPAGAGVENGFDAIGVPRPGHGAPASSVQVLFGQGPRTTRVRFRADGMAGPVDVNLTVVGVTVNGTAELVSSRYVIHQSDYDNPVQGAIPATWTSMWTEAIYGVGVGDMPMESYAYVDYEAPQVGGLPGATDRLTAHATQIIVHDQASSTYDDGHGHAYLPDWAMAQRGGGCPSQRLLDGARQPWPLFFEAEVASSGQDQQRVEIVDSPGPLVKFSRHNVAEDGQANVVFETAIVVGHHADQSDPHAAILGTAPVWTRRASLPWRVEGSMEIRRFGGQDHELGPTSVRLFGAPDETSWRTVFDHDPLYGMDWDTITDAPMGDDDQVDRSPWGVDFMDVTDGSRPRAFHYSECDGSNAGDRRDIWYP